MEFGAIARDGERKIFRPPKNFENFRAEFARNLTHDSMPTLGTDVGDLRGS